MQRCGWTVGLSLVLAAASSAAAAAETPLAPAPASPRVAWQRRDASLPEWPSAPSEHAPAPALGLKDLEQIALDCNPTLRQAGMAVRAAEGRWVQAGLYPNPRIGYVADEIGNDRSAGLQGAAIRQEIVLGGKLRLGRAAASHEIQQARAAWEAQRQRVLNDVRKGYYDVLLAQKTIEVNEQLVRVGEEGVEVAEKLLAAMEVSKADVLQARIEAEMASLSLHEARNRLQSAWRRLAAVLGTPALEVQPLAGRPDAELPQLEWEDLVAELLAGSPEIAEAAAAVERARCELAHQCALRKPNLDLGAAVKYDDGTGFTVADVELSMPLPLFDRNQGNVVRARAGLIAAEAEVRRIDLALRQRLAAAFERYANARRQVDTYAETILPHARSSLELVSTGYREGEFAYLTLLTAQRTFFNVNLNYLGSLAELWARSVELEGMLLDGGLQRPQ